jgi:hypothetical protein
MKKLRSTQHRSELVTTVRTNARHPADFRTALRTLLRRERDPIEHSLQKISDRAEGSHLLADRTNPQEGPRMGLCLIGPSIVPRCYFALAAGPGGLSPRSAALCAERRTMLTDQEGQRLERKHHDA